MSKYNWLLSDSMVAETFGGLHCDWCFPHKTEHLLLKNEATSINCNVCGPMDHGAISYIIAILHVEKFGRNFLIATIMRCETVSRVKREGSVLYRTNLILTVNQFNLHY